MKLCKICGEQNALDNIYCTNCGSQDLAVVSKTYVTCAKCSNKCDSIFTHCINCGAELTSAKQPANQNQTTTIAVDVFSVKETSVKEETLDCPHCGGIVSLHDVFCPQCGKDVTKYNIHKIVKRKICKFCGHPNSITAKYCSYCFFDLSDSEVEDFQLDYKQYDNAKAAYLQSATSNRKKICSNCATLNDENSLFCIKCGLQLTAEIPKVYCFVCGKENPPDASFCVSCRYPLGSVSAEEIASGWKCECGSFNKKEDKYCSDCGRAKKINAEEAV